MLESSFCAHESLQKDTDTRQLTNNTKYNNCDPNRNLNLSWTGDFSSFKQFIEANVNIRGVWRSPGDERKTYYSDGNTTIMWWKNKKKIQVTGKDSNSIKEKLCDILLGNLFIEKHKADHNDEGRYVNACRCDCGDIRTDIEGMKLDIVINETGLRREINRNAQTISELQKLNSTCPSSADLEDIKHAIATLQLKLEGLQIPGNDDISNVGETFSDREQPISKNSNNEKVCISPQIWNSTKIRLETSNKNIMNSGRLLVLKYLNRSKVQI